MTTTVPLEQLDVLIERLAVPDETEPEPVGDELDLRSSIRLLVGEA